MNFDDTIDMVSKTANENYTSLRKLSEINLNSWDQLVNKQMEVMKSCFETSAKQAEIGKDTKRADELFGKQADLARELGEQMVEGNQQVMDILNKTREEYQALVEAGAAQAKSQVEAGAAQAKSQMEQVTPVKTKKAA